MTTNTGPTVPNERLVRRVALASGIGSMLEFYDFYLYGALSATIFGTLFFHSEDPAVGTLLALATFGVGFVARPVGGIIAGHFGDKVGRKSVLIATLAFGLITPPYGLVLLMASKFVGVSFAKALRAALPIYVVFLVTICFTIYFPKVVLWLPKHVIPESVGCFKSPAGTGYICPQG